MGHVKEETLDADNSFGLLVRRLTPWQLICRLQRSLALLSRKSSASVVLSLAPLWIEGTVRFRGGGLSSEGAKVLPIRDHKQKQSERQAVLPFDCSWSRVADAKRTGTLSGWHRVPRLICPTNGTILCWSPSNQGRGRSTWFLSIRSRPSTLCAASCFFSDR